MVVIYTFVPVQSLWYYQYNTHNIVGSDSQKAIKRGIHPKKRHRYTGHEKKSDLILVPMIRF